MPSDIRRVPVSFGVMAVLLVGVAYLDFGVERFAGWSLLNLLVAVTATGALAAAWWFDGRRRLAPLGLAVGVFAFAFGVTGGSMGCYGVEYPPSADYGATYDWASNTLSFGEHTDGSNHRCFATPNRAVLFVGYALASLGAVELGE
ncbi:hypothetical protein [Halorussus salinus]|uniref:hypothetical protein n=1 Tax=Halorussus salinus TaxID=1364935 RepID=UPI00109228FC|nr:hypothetical protein [Halorussus salinus]